MNTDRSIEYDYIKKFLNTEKKIIEIPDNILFEGGDIIQEGNYMFVGISSRTNIQIVTILKDLFPNKNIIPIHHTALHLDCCFCILDNKLVFYDSKYIENISLPNKFTIFDIASIVDSGKYMATNFVRVGNTLIMSKIKKNAIFRKILRDIGYKIILINTQNIWKEGGSIRCLTQWL
jgi:N-dimethylarginine dimethylaminohydrolase